MEHTPTNFMTPVATLEVPLAQIGLCEKWRLRPTDYEWVRHLAEDTDANEWDALFVRRWPDDQPRTPDYAAAVYDCASGWHRTLAAHRKHLDTVRIEVYDAPDDASMLLLASRGNARHGKPMAEADNRDLVKRLASLGTSQGDIARWTGIPKSTVSAWLTGRDTNAAKKSSVMMAPMRGGDTAESSTRQASGIADLTAVSTRQTGADVPPLGTRDVAQVGVALNRVLAANVTGLRVDGVEAWIALLDETEYTRYLRACGRLYQWFAAFATAMMSPRYTREEVAQMQLESGVPLDQLLPMLFSEQQQDQNQDQEDQGETA